MFATSSENVAGHSSGQRPAASGQRPAQSFRLFLLLTLACGAAVLAGFGLVNRFRPKAITVETISNNSIEDAPRRIAPLAPVLFSKDSDEAMCIHRVLRSPQPVPQPGPRNLPYCLHLIRLYGWGSIPGPHFTSGREVFAALTDLASSERYFG